MKLLQLCFLLSVFFVSETFAATSDFQEYFVKNSDSDIVQSVSGVSEIVPTDKMDVEPANREKRSYYSNSPCAHNRNRFDTAPNMEYNNSPYRSYPGEDYYDTPPNPHFPNYLTPSYHPPTYNAPSYHAPAYNAPSYYPSTYNSPSYNRPNYQQPLNNAYDHNKYPTAANFYPHQQSYGTPSSSLLVGCHPHVMPFPDLSHFASSRSPAYRHSEHQKPQQSEPTTPSYRFHSAEEPPVPAVNAESNGINDNKNNEPTPEKVPLLDNSINETQSVTDSPAKDAVNNENDETTKPPEEVKAQKHESLFKMAQFHNQNRSKTMTVTDDKQKGKVSWNV